MLAVIALQGQCADIEDKLIQALPPQQVGSRTHKPIPNPESTPHFEECEASCTCLIEGGKAESCKQKVADAFSKVNS